MCIFRLSRSFSLTTHIPSWYYSFAKKPAMGWFTVLNKEKHISASDFRVNEGIRVKEVRLIDAEGENVGVVPIKKALEPSMPQIQKEMPSVAGKLNMLEAENMDAFFLNAKKKMSQ